MRSAASNLFTQTIGMVNVARGRPTTKLQLRQAAMIRHQMARLFALTVMRIRILLAANNTKLESAEDEERETKCLSLVWYATLFEAYPQLFVTCP